MTDDVLRVAVLTVPGLFGLWAAVACRRAQYHGLPGADALVWAGLSGAFFLLSLMKTARGLGLLRGFGDFLRGIFKQRGWYEDRRSLQIAASIAVAVVVMALVVWGLRWTWHRIKRYRLAIGFVALTVGFGIIRFISLHEVDAWNAHAPWARTAVDLRRRCWGIGGGHRPALPAHRAARAVCRFRYVINFGAGALPTLPYSGSVVRVPSTGRSRRLVGGTLAASAGC